MKILVTGGAGFIGANFIKYMLSKYDYTIINLDKLTYAGNQLNLTGLNESDKYHFVKGDIGNRELLFYLFQQFGIDAVVHFAAETHVDRSINDPNAFVYTNIIGTQNLLDVSKSSWNLNPDDKYSIQYKENVKFIHISTDEVYGTLGEEGEFTEETCLSPNSPYSASKASSDLLVRSYFETYKLPVIITRCSNNYGPYQYPEKLIPLMVYRALRD